ncbi:SDR family NAD(P)-dependent oxidoreductase [Sphingomonas koreensis]|jgi:NAD(P)-dependent dehydrogenase (short-subunit alcohol dehydrogenase family)|uniref:SDR family NAD(P)-dependent oxidoreductase n=1 Tax=Sphingomonas koreensis TaxID=93064 RepID=A0A430G7H7_9SPHN|nr:MULTISPECIES: SDR family NAD(P)-dependent oxidoreductase [Sphingomonas]MDK2768861.1 SDR family oxidoreductase [Sphingomonas sp.]PKP93918.1 MAG: 3-oxoacyl-ACP reductase [Alphaproteobacteria bacterium HGW-Alphaproteobacteria-16]PZU59957.1 MAG: 3-oxoacyl-ACP reductase [Sphingobium sp.]RSY89460.1 SDR family NAD(P)-dependent oxidoreductase [Sphingomonas koreensis]
MKLAGRRILITGAASGIGRATAELFAREGAALALLDRRDDLLRSAAQATAGTAMLADLADEAQLLAAVAKAAQAMGGIDGIVNSAGIAGSQPLDALDRESWDRFVAINLTAPYLICRAALPHLQVTGNATIVNIASGQALLPNAPGIAAYAATKAGLVAFTKALGAELAPGIRANVIAPGIVDTPMVQGVLGGYASPDDAPFVQQYAMKRVARPSELAEAILFLSSEASSYVTGTVLAVDGGRTFH